MTMNPELAKLGSSLLVPSKDVPPRYLRTDEDSTIISHLNPLPQVPVIDMQKSVATSSCHRYAKVIFPTRTGEAPLS
ncbi:hypothetical protein Gogos_004331, partial [Gossypium gossypioides]|nr:hypothetical protein [Gossypium gossypioides]